MTRRLQTKLLVLSALACSAGCGSSAGSSAESTGSGQAAATAASTSSFFLHDNDTVVFFGDSISSLYAPTWSPWSPDDMPPNDANYTYCMDIVSWVTTQMPGSGIKFYDMAVPGETTAGDEWPTNGPHATSFAPGYGGDIASHLAYIESLNPTVVTVDLGMNDGEYISNDTTLANDFTAGISNIVGSLLAWSKATGSPLRVVVLAPSYFDYARYVATGWNPGWTISPTYNATLQGFGAWERSYIASLGNPNVTFIDLNAPMVAATSGLAYGQSLTQEGIHPTVAGYDVIAATILEAWGASGSTLSYPNITSVWSAFVKGQANIWNGAKEYEWTGPAITTPAPSGPAPVDLTVEDPQGLFWDSGNFQRGGTVLQVYPSYIPNAAQDWAWTASGGGFTVCNTSGSPCLSDNGGEVIMGSKADIITITSSSAIVDLTTGRYFQNPAGAASGSYVTTGTTESAWTFSSSLH